MLQNIASKSFEKKQSKETKSKQPQGFSKHYQKQDIRKADRKRRSLFCLAREQALKKQYTKETFEKESSYYLTAIDVFFHKQLTDHTEAIASLDRLEASTEAAFLTEKLSSMVHTMNSSGITQTSIVLSDDCFEMLKSTQVTITHFDTAPSSFHIEFFTQEEGVKLLLSSLDLLQNHLDKRFQKSNFFLAKPVYNSKFEKKKRELVSNYKL